VDPKAIADLKERLEKSRRFTVELDGRTFHLLLPDPFVERRVLRSADLSLSEFGYYEQTTRDIVEVALVGWEGVTYADLLRGEDDQLELEFSPAIAKLLLNERLDILDALKARLAEERARRRESVEGDAKNSARASTGS
jgi:hypothetical protein